MAENQNDKTVETQQRSSKKWVIMIGVTVAVLLIGGGGYFFLQQQKQTEPGRQGEGSKAAALIKPIPEDAGIGPIVEINEFIVNIIGTDTAHYVRASLSLELDRESAVEEVGKRMPQIRDAVLLLIGNKTFEELQDIQGKNQVKAELKSKINSFLRTGKVSNVYLTDFVVQ
ncbi:flagellar basal body-associated FliL family protein [Desulfobulbus oligotrophicus]|jgi:flagellar FliL protein|uniref:Flagellar protein FliL n=1 Tax=Desulfobulbus oligotrophicus TaxID=1909699 RepID=A0A7T5VDN8_9BACT|nr:flagellar basal body-associated FliL family protein [Desulfobulbus oligotrophicus]MDY0389326.1 flagellar basal body-associated FliL family protein [Desulfobulbus oligotrophicus]QQG66025.1 flagellar basal body-associated FliL family protein [Desulfobulbus oligotrophicus]